MAFQPMPTPPPGAIGPTTSTTPGAPPPPPPGGHSPSGVTAVPTGTAADGYTVAASVGASPMSSIDVVMAAAGAIHPATAANLVHSGPQSYIPVSQYPAGEFCEPKSRFVTGLQCRFFTPLVQPLT